MGIHVHIGCPEKFNNFVTLFAVRPIIVFIQSKDKNTYPKLQ